MDADPASSGIPFIHLFFADDLLILVEAFYDQERVMNSVPDIFCTSFRVKVNKSKNQVFSSKNVIIEETRKITNILL